MDKDNQQCIAKATAELKEAFSDKVQVKIKLLHPNAVIPTRATPGSFGYDVTATSKAEPIKDFFEVPIERKTGIGTIATCGVYRPGFFFGHVMYGLGFALEIPLGEGAWLLPRSSIKKHNMILANSPGMFDSDYRDEAQACFYFNNTSTLYEPGERIAQFVFLPDPDVEFVVVDELTPTERKGGFGSTGK